MSNRSNDYGRAYEFICLKTLEQEIGKIRSVSVDKNSSYIAASHAWQKLPDEYRNNYLISASVAVRRIFDMEPRIIEDCDDELELLIQQDSCGKSGDVRDILIIRRRIAWEIGLSLKHNHFAVKHSRLSAHLDFGKEWYDVPCSQQYWNRVSPIFEYLSVQHNDGLKFSDLPNKQDDIYVPILKAFMNEIRGQYLEHKDIPSKLVEYLLGRFDFYKVISLDDSRRTLIQGFNLHGTLNKNGTTTSEPSIEIPLVKMPTRIVSLDFVPESKTTVELYLDEGWQFTFRLHNAATKVEPSLKFDVQIKGIPTAIITINCLWN